MNKNSTICAIATPAGSGAIAVIRLSGSEAIPIVERIFKAKKKGLKLSNQNPYSIVFGEIVDGADIIDEVLVSIFRAPKSYTGEDSIEISCHGSIFIQQKILELLIKNGARSASPGEFTKRAFLNGKMDLAQAEGVADLIASESKAMHTISIQQLKGGFSAELEKLRSQMLNFAALIELELDFSEEDVEFADRDNFLKLIEQTALVLKQMVDSFSLGNAIKNGVNVAIVGAPNVGKSTLLNHLLKEERAIVSEIAGTTRDAIEDTMVIDGLLFRFIDTAGLRASDDLIESIGIDIAYAKIQQAKIVLLLVDATAQNKQIQKQYQTIKDKLTANQTLKVILNKIDQLGSITETDLKKKLKSQDSIISISAKLGDNVDILQQVLVELVRVENSSSNLIISNIRHLEALSKALEAIERTRDGIKMQLATDFLAMDIRDAVHFIGEITGAISNDELLGHIFKNFCIGK